MSAGAALLTLPQLLALGAALLLIMGVSCWLLLSQDKAARQLADRIETVSSSYARATPLQKASRQKAERSGTARVWAMLGGVFGFDLARAVHYPVKVPVVLAGALGLAVVVSYLVGAVLGDVARLAIPLLWIGASRKAFNSFEQRRAGKLYNQFPDALAMIVRSVRVGIPVSDSVRAVSKEALEPTATEFGNLSDQLAIGVALEDALRDCAVRNRLPEYRFFATTLSLQAQTGGGLSETLENLSDVIRKRVAARSRAYAMASEARTSTYILAALPGFTAGALAVLNPSYISLLFTEPSGNVVLAIAICMLSTGMYVMRSIIRKSLQ